MQRDYDEERELQRYIFLRFDHLMTEPEHRANRADFFLKKAAQGSGKVAEKMRTKIVDSDEVADLLSGGSEAFRMRVVARVQKEEASKLYINRCEACDRIVATPRACMCTWCGHSWFDRRQSQNELAASYGV